MFPAVALLSAIALAPSVWAHGMIKAVSADGSRVLAPNVYYDGDAKNAQTVVRKMYRSDGQSFVLPGAFGDANQMACEGAGPAPKLLDVNAGSNVVIEWEGSTGELMGFNGKYDSNPWVHATGPVTDYLASCNGDCTNFNAAGAGWTKIAQFGLDNSQTISQDLRNRMAAKPETYYPTSGPGLWGSAKLIQQDSTWTVNIPSALAPGQYILRTEIAALHSPAAAQLYIGCIQLNVKGSGTAQLPAGTNAGALYSTNGDFANYNIYSRQSNLEFNNPGPAIWDQTSSAPQQPQPPVKNEPQPPVENQPQPPAENQPQPPAENQPQPPAENQPETPSTPAPNAPACKNRKRSNRVKRIIQHRRNRASGLKH